jgi:hypothetical protein
MIYLKLNHTGIPELDNKIIAMTDNFPDREYKIKGPNPSLWTLLQPALITPGSYEMFNDIFAEERKQWVDSDTEIFNDKLVDNKFKAAIVIKTFTVNSTWFIVLENSYHMRFVLMVGNRPLQDRPDISGGKDGYFWTEDFYKKRTSKSSFKKVFGLTKAESNEFMNKY